MNTPSRLSSRRIVRYLCATFTSMCAPNLSSLCRFSGSILNKLNFAKGAEERRVHDAEAVHEGRATRRKIKLVEYLALIWAGCTGCQWAGPTPQENLMAQSQAPRPSWVQSPPKGYTVEEKTHIVDLSLGLKQAQGAALQRHPQAHIADLYWEKKTDYTVWVLVQL